jgi:hypothetical protein
MPFIETADRTSLFVTDWGSIELRHHPRQLEGAVHAQPPHDHVRPSSSAER